MTARKAGRGPAASEPKRPRIMVVDDHPIMREGLTRVIEEGGDFVVCAQAASIQRALELVKTTQPDLIIVDIALGGQNGLELIKDVKVRHPKLPMLVHSMHEEQIYAQRSLRAGATRTRRETGAAAFMMRMVFPSGPFAYGPVDEGSGAGLCPSVDGALQVQVKSW